MNDADQTAGAQGKLLNEVARHLAVRMSYEDVVRVAQAKIAPERMRRIAQDELRVQNEPYSVHDFLKPGIEELTQLLPPCWRGRSCAIRSARGWLGRVYFGMEINATSVSGYLRFLMLAKLRCAAARTASATSRSRRRSKSWLALIAEAAQLSTRSRARNRRMRAADQGLWRHLCARARQLPRHRGARDPPGARRPYPAGARRRRGRQRPHRRPDGSRRRKPRQMPGRDRRWGEHAAGGGIRRSHAGWRTFRKRAARLQPHPLSAPVPVA